MKSEKQLLVLALTIVFVQVVAYWIVGHFVSTHGAMPVPQVDTTLYCQAARRIVEGAPFSFSAGTAPSTGTTSVLYPFVLAIPYALGFRGDALLSAGFWLNAAFYLVFLASWCLVAWRTVANGTARVLAVMALAIFGHSVYSALAQSDIGIWMAVSALMAYGLLSDRFNLFAVMLVLSPWVRPEGVFFGLAFAVIALCAGRMKRRELVLVLVWAVSVVGVFALNYALTGHAQFSSVAHKGYFKDYCFSSAVQKTFQDLVQIVRDLLLGQSAFSPRNLVGLPLLGGLLLVLGVNAHEWKRGESWRALAWFGAAFLGVLSVASSGWQGTNMDRYMAWLMPMLIILSVEGTVFLAACCRQRCVANLLLVAFIGFLSASAIGYLAIFARSSAYSDQMRMFSLLSEELMPKGASVGAFTESGNAYYLSDRRFAHVSGVYSPEFEHMSVEESLDDLKRNPDKRFDYWMLLDELPAHRDSDYAEGIFGPCVLAGPGSRALHCADWAAFDAAGETPAAVTDEVLKARVDVGYPADERAANYEVIDRYSRRPADPLFICARNADGRLLADVGRVIAGGDAMDVALEPGKDVRVVMRIFPQATAPIRDGTFDSELKGRIPERFSMNITVDGRLVGRVELGCDQKRFSDVSFTVPGQAIVNPVSRIAFLGDHIPFGYWFYQKEARP